MSQPFTFRWHGQHNNEHTEWTFKYTNWSALLEEVRNLTSGRNCTYEGCYHAGGRHIVRRLVFSEGETWLARVPIVPSGNFDPNARSAWWTVERKFVMESEIATMKYIANTTNLPVPTIFGYQASMDSNPVKLPYVLMQCIRGNMLYDLGGPDILTSEQRKKVRMSVAAVQCQMASICLGKIGSLIFGADGMVDIGPLPASFGFQGPFSSPIDYFLSWSANAKFKNSKFLLKQSNDDTTLKALKHEVECFPARLASALEDRPPTGGTSYPLVHKDFLIHNILFDEEYNVVGVIDWENTHSAPFEVFAALTNMYSHFDSKALHMVPDEKDGKAYIHDVMHEEVKMKLANKISSSFGSILGDIGYCMNLFEEGRATCFTHVLKRYVES